MTIKSNTCFKKNGEPLSEYFSELEAREAATYANKNHRRNLVPYKCEKCGHWHLSPENRVTPNRICKFCVDSKGKQKKLYGNFESAQRRAKIIWNERGISLDVYECPHSLGYHLTSNGR